MNYSPKGSGREVLQSESSLKSRPFRTTLVKSSKCRRDLSISQDRLVEMVGNKTVLNF